MSSTNKTANIGLNQWVLTDPFNMADFNSDNAKIDAALASNPMVKLMDVTLSAVVSTLQLDLSSFDLAKFGELKLYVDVANTSYKALRVNSVSASSYYVYYGNGSNTSVSSITFDQSMYTITFAHNYFWFDLQTQFDKFSLNKSAFPKLNTLDLYSSMAGAYDFSIGDRFTLWGVKK